MDSPPPIGLSQSDAETLPGPATSGNRSRRTGGTVPSDAQQPAHQRVPGNRGLRSDRRLGVRVGTRGGHALTDEQVHKCIAYGKGGCDIEQTAKNIELKLKGLNYD